MATPHRQIRAFRLRRPPDFPAHVALQLAEIRRRFAASEGPIVPVLTPDERGAYDWTRLVCERTVTINTTASGGNASLLSLAEEPDSLEPRASG